MNFHTALKVNLKNLPDSSCSSAEAVLIAAVRNLALDVCVFSTCASSRFHAPAVNHQKLQCAYAQVE